MGYLEEFKQIITKPPYFYWLIGNVLVISFIIVGNQILLFIKASAIWPVLSGMGGMKWAYKAEKEGRFWTAAFFWLLMRRTERAIAIARNHPYEFEIVFHGGSNESGGLYSKTGPTPSYYDIIVIGERIYRELGLYKELVEYYAKCPDLKELKDSANRTFDKYIEDMYPGSIIQQNQGKKDNVDLYRQAEKTAIDLHNNLHELIARAHENQAFVCMFKRFSKISIFREHYNHYYPFGEYHLEGYHQMHILGHINSLKGLWGIDNEANKYFTLAAIEYEKAGKNEKAGLCYFYSGDLNKAKNSLRMMGLSDDEIARIEESIKKPKFVSNLTQYFYEPDNRFCSLGSVLVGIMTLSFGMMKGYYNGWDWLTTIAVKNPGIIERFLASIVYSFVSFAVGCLAGYVIGGIVSIPIYPLVRIVDWVRNRLPD